MSPIAWAIPALAVVLGWLAWSHLGAGRPAGDEDGAEAALAPLLLGVFLTGFLGLVLAEAGQLRPALLLLAQLLAIALLAGRRAVAAREALRSAPKLLPLGPIVLLAAWLGKPASADLFGGRDAGVYANIGAHLARHGALSFDYAPLARLDKATRETLLGGDLAPIPFLPGLATTDFKTGRMVPQFYHLFPVYLALGYWLWGFNGLFLAPPALGVLAAASLLLVARRLGRSWLAGTAGATLLAINLPWVWNTRNPYSEVPYALAVIVLWMSLERAASTASRRWMVLAGLAVGVTLLTHVSALLVIPPLAIACLTASHRDGGRMARTVLPLALAFLAWSLLHGRFWANWYFGALWPQIRILGPLAVIASVGTLVLAGRRLTSRLLDRLHGRLAWMALSGLVTLGLVYSLFIRPEGGFALHMWGGKVPTSWYECMVWQAWYWSLGGMALLWMGLLVLSWEALPGRRPGALPFLCVFLPVAALYGYNPWVSFDHPWAMRRYVPLMIPGTALAIAAGLGWLSRRPRGWRWMGGAAAVGSFAWVAWHETSLLLPFRDLRERSGLLQELEALAERLPPRSMTLITSPGVDWFLGTPLLLAWDREVMPVYRFFPLRDPRTQGIFEAQVGRWLDEGYEVLWLTSSEASAPHRADRILWEPYDRFEGRGLSWGGSVVGPPRQPEKLKMYFHLARARPADGPPPCAPSRIHTGGSFIGRGLGLDFLERTADGQLFRWAEQVAAVAFPACRPTPDNGLLALELEMAAGDRPPDLGPCEVSVILDNDVLGTVRLSSSFERYRLPIEASRLDHETGPTVQLFGCSAIPTDDRRVLSFALSEVALLPATDADEVPLLNPTISASGPDLDLGRHEQGFEMAGFYWPEVSGTRDYRWSRGTSHLMWPGRIPDGATALIVEAATNRPSGTPAPLLEATLNGCPLPATALQESGWARHRIPLPDGLERDRIDLELRVPSWTPEGDSRELGIAIDRVQLE